MAEAKTKIRGITLEQVDNFGVDDHDRLYWRNRDGSYSQLRMSLPGAVQWSAVSIALGTLVLAAVAVVDSPICRAGYEAIIAAIHHGAT